MSELGRETVKGKRQAGRKKWELGEGERKRGKCKGRRRDGQGEAE